MNLSVRSLKMKTPKINGRVRHAKEWWTTLSTMSLAVALLFIVTAPIQLF